MINEIQLEKELDDIDAETVYTCLEKTDSEITIWFELGVGIGMEIEHICKIISSNKFMPAYIKRNVIRALKWKYNQLKPEAEQCPIK